MSISSMTGFGRADGHPLAVSTVTPRSSMRWRSKPAASRSSWRGIRWSSCSTTVTSAPRRCIPRAASSPSRPPPTTTDAPSPKGACDQRLHIGGVAKSEDARAVAAGDLRHERLRSGGQNQRRIGMNTAVRGLNPASDQHPARSRGARSTPRPRRRLRSKARW